MPIYSIHSPLFTKAIYEDTGHPQRPWLGLVMRKGDHQPVTVHRARTEGEAWKLAERDRKRIVAYGINPAA